MPYDARVVVSRDVAVGRCLTEDCEFVARWTSEHPQNAVRWVKAELSKHRAKSKHRFNKPAKVEVVWTNGIAE